MNRHPCPDVTRPEVPPASPRRRLALFLSISFHLTVLVWALTPAGPRATYCPSGAGDLVYLAPRPLGARDVISDVDARVPPENLPCRQDAIPCEALPEPFAVDRVPQPNLPAALATLDPEITVGTPVLTRCGPSAAGIGCVAPAPATRPVLISCGAYRPDVVYVLDASGASMTIFDDVRHQLRRSIDAVRPNQRFTIIRAEPGDAPTCLDRVPQLATPNFKRAAYDFLDKTAPHGPPEILPALRAAFACTPDIIYLLTEGEFADNAEVTDALRKLNPNRRVKVNVIDLLGAASPASDDDAHSGPLKRLAAEHGGTYRSLPKYVAR